ncbi:MAG: peptidylprolyl isomerase [bacterium]|nr:peptidylprolyl isomerase [Candidatus Sumerlaeota bacterium]
MHIHSRIALPFIILLVFSAYASAETTTTAAVAPSTKAQPPAADSPGSGAMKPSSPTEEAFMGPYKLESGTYAVFHTTEGDFLARLFDKQTPNTVANFTGLATGRKKWQHPVTMAQNTRPLYNNTTIYQAMKDIFIKSGDPTDTGRHGANHTLEMEAPEAFNFSSPGMLAMERVGKNSDGSRWIVTLTPLPDWNGRYTIFGQVMGGLDIVRIIARKPSRKPSLPLEPVLINTVEIVQVTPDQHTTASFSLEDGRKMLTIDKETAQQNTQSTASRDTITTGAAPNDAGSSQTAQ